jgi:hypothetical protein
MLPQSLHNIGLAISGHRIFGTVTVRPFRSVFNENFMNILTFKLDRLFFGHVEWFSCLCGVAFAQVAKLEDLYAYDCHTNTGQRKEVRKQSGAENFILTAMYN